VGAIATLLIVGAVIAFIVLRGRRANHRPVHYASIDANAISTPTNHKHYDVLTPSEVGNDNQTPIA
jgi:hypothetical protein